MKQLPPLLAIVGPTAVGKTQLSIEVARALDAEILSADSRLLYRGMNIGTAKPSLAEREMVPHHLIDVADPDQTWSLTTYKAAALDVISDLHARQKLPILVGGTGQYLTALIEGWNPPPRPDDDRLREELQTLAETHGHEALHARLVEVDPESAQRIQSTNVRRVVRALEITQLTGKPASEQRDKVLPTFRSLCIGLRRPRHELYQRIDQRLEQMLEAGFVAEVKGLLAKGYSPDTPSMSAIGYKQIGQYLQGDMDLEDALQQIRKKTRLYVRRQDTWFRKQLSEIHWVDVRPGVSHTLLDLTRSWLASSP